MFFSHYTPDHYFRLEARSHLRDLENGFAARIYDPLWFLTRQWMMGEHQAENASTPVRVTYRASEARLRTPPEDGRDPTVTPAEVILESEAEDWWTFGRRIHFGAMFAARLAPVPPPEQARLRQLPAPYEAFEGGPDGLALWRQREALGLLADEFPEIPAEPPKQSWKPAELAYTAQFPNDKSPLTAPHHAGGEVDWYTVDGDPLAQPADIQPGDLPEKVVFPAQLQYPGAPHDRWWEIESAEVDIGGFPPDRGRFATLLLTDLVLAHSVDWFLFPVNTHGGVILTLHEAIVTDGFGQTYKLEMIPSSEWSLFKSRHLEQDCLVVWLTAAQPLQGRPLERVQFGLDEYANLLWAVERRVDGREIEFTLPQPPDTAAQAEADLTRPKTYTYRTGQEAAPFWHPYVMEDGDGVRRYRQARLDAALFPGLPEVYVEQEGDLRLLPAPRAQVLNTAQGVHSLDPAAVPVNGIEVERSWRLARDVFGRPVLWIQRQRKPLMAPPGRRFRYDVLQSR